MMRATPVIQDPSLEGIPTSLTAAYADMNNTIARMFNPFSEHILSSRHAVLETADAALTNASPSKSKKAIILGAGNCFDLPLPEIIDGFDQTTLVDVDPSSTERALSDLSARELGKVSLVGADITGVMGEFGSSVERLRSTEPRMGAFIRAAAQILDGINPLKRQPDMREDYSFVCSQLVLTQLGSLPFLTLSGQLAQDYGTPLSMRPGMEDEPLMLAINRLNIKMQVGHIRYLAQLVNKLGTVHFADTYFEAVVTPSGSVPMPMVFDEEISEVMDASFFPISPRRGWWWKQPSGKQFYVASHSLESNEP